MAGAQDHDAEQHGPAPMKNGKWMFTASDQPAGAYGARPPPMNRTKL